jgi:predicted AlkP superfamily pyrophosphatase or phosphodiesterase
MKIKYLLFITFAFASLSLSAQIKKKKPAVVAAPQEASTALPRPKLVVGIVVDQMRWDYLYRFYDRYQSNGFKRLLNDGFSCENTQVDYIPTFTGPGHSCIYTGSVPSIHGIAANDYIIQATRQPMYCTEILPCKLLAVLQKQGKCRRGICW